MNTNEKCPQCGCERIGKGKFRGYANLYPAGKLFSMGSEVVAYVCTNCGYIVKLEAARPDIFKKK